MLKVVQLRQTGNSSHAEGDNTIARNHACHSEGKFNIGKNDTIHETGIGSNDTNRKNAFEIYTDGRIRAPELTKNLVNDNRSLITKEYGDANYKGEVSELELILEGGNTGWALFGDNRDPKDDIGEHAIDLSYDNGYGTHSGATGIHSMVTGYETSANGDYSVVTGYRSMATGKISTASGAYSSASGYASYSEGLSCTASGKCAHAEGKYTNAVNDNMHSAGIWNIGTTGTIHETGIGTASNNKKNAFEIYTDGRIRAPELTNGLVDDNRSLITKEYGDANYKGGAISINDLTDADTTSNAPTQDDYLMWNGLNWVPASPETISIDEMSDVDTTDVANGQVLKWDGTNWKPSDDLAGTDTTYTAGTGLNLTGSEFSISSNINNLNDVDTTDVANGQVLKWDGTNWKPSGNNNALLGEIDFDGATGDDTFIITGKVIKELYVYIEGLKIRANEFIFSDNGTDTTITLNSALTSNAWISVEYLKEI